MPMTELFNGTDSIKSGEPVGTVIKINVYY